MGCALLVRFVAVEDEVTVRVVVVVELTVRVTVEDEVTVRVRVDSLVLAEDDDDVGLPRRLVAGTRAVPEEPVSSRRASLAA